MIDSIKKNVDLVQKYFIAFSFYNEHEDKAARDLSKESAEFLWLQLFKDVLLQLPKSSQAKKELVDFCCQYYHGNKREQENITAFTQSYQSAESIHWYTKDSFLYRLVNKALRTEDIGQLQTFRFFISDLSSKLAEIHRIQIRECSTTVKLYRGLKLENDDLKRLKLRVGCIISANGFLSTSRSREVAVKFAMRGTNRTNIVPVLYEIECSLDVLESIVFADITDYSVFAKEKEVLFDLGSTFIIKSVSRDEQLNMVVIKLIATDAGVKMAQKYVELNRKTNEETTPDILFGVLMIQMGKYDQSLSYFENLLEGSNDKVDEARIYHEIGSAYLCKGELDKAFMNADRAYQIMIKTKQSRIKDSSRLLAIMAHVSLRRKVYEESLDLYFEALEVREKFYGRKHLDTASALNNVGNAYLQKEQYTRSLEYYQKALHFFKKQLPDYHFYIAVSLNNLGLVHWKMEDVNSALNYHREALEMRKQLLPSGHNHIIQSLHNLTDILYKEGRLDESLQYFTQLLTIEKSDFDPTNHNDLVSRLKKYFELRPPDALVVFASTDHAHVIHRMGNCKAIISMLSICNKMCSRTNYLFASECLYQEATVGMPIGLTKREDLTVLEDFIKALKSDSDYQSALEKARTILMNSSQNCISGYNYTKYLTQYLGDLVEAAYYSDDNSMKALHFYDKVQYILEDKIPYWVNTKYIKNICSKRIKQKKTHDQSILKEFIVILGYDSNYDWAVDTVDDLLEESSQPFTSGYNHTKYLMACLSDLIMNAHDSDDESIEALHFYEKVRLVLEYVISRWGNTDHIQIISLKRIGHIRQINSLYEPAVEAFEQSVKMQREHDKSLIDIPDTLRCIGLLHMTFGNYKSALTSFNKTLELLQPNFYQKDREIRLLHKRINQATEGLKSVMDSS